MAFKVGVTVQIRQFFDRVGEMAVVVRKTPNGDCMILNDLGEWRCVEAGDILTDDQKLKVEVQ